MTRLSKHAEKELELKRHMLQLHAFEKDIKESFVRSSGPGGQNVNKVSTCVILQHIPTGIRVRCETHRTQAMNRYHARRILIEKIERRRAEDHLREIQEFRKRKRQTRKRPTFVKEEVLQRKHRQSEKKANRRRIKPKDVDLFE